MTIVSGCSLQTLCHSPPFLRDLETTHPEEVVANSTSAFGHKNTPKVPSILTVVAFGIFQIIFCIYGSAVLWLLSLPILLILNFFIVTELAEMLKTIF